MAQGSSRQKRKRKQRAARKSSGAAAMARGYERSRQKNEEARAALVPLEPGERPTAVTVGAAVAAIGVLSNLVGLVLGAGKAPPLVMGTLISGLVAYGMWKARYWAVLGMQTILAFTIVGGSLALVFATSVPHALIALVVVGAAGTLFWFLVKAMARIQMPERPGASGSG